LVQGTGTYDTCGPVEANLDDNVVFEKLLHSKVDHTTRCSFSIAATALMLSVVETLGTFRDTAIPKSKSKDRSKKAFFVFLSNHMNQWNVNEPNTMKSVAEVLWQSFRNGITHALRVDRISGVNQLWGSLEFQENFANTANARFKKHGQLLRICPRALFDDLDAGVRDYFQQLSSNTRLQTNFLDRFDEVYPS
jgi:hypothetical protein